MTTDEQTRTLARTKAEVGLMRDFRLANPNSWFDPKTYFAAIRQFPIVEFKTKHSGWHSMRERVKEWK